MYFSTLFVDVGGNPDRPRPGRMWLRNLYHVHQRLCMGFPSDTRRKCDPQFLAPYRSKDFAEQRLFADRSSDDVDEAALKYVHTPRCSDHGFLFRVEPQPDIGRVVILVQSGSKPDWDYAFQNAKHLLAAYPHVKLFDCCFEQGERFRFRLKANPTRKIDTKTGPDGRRRNGKRVPVQTDQLDEWLVRKAGFAGFSIDSDSLVVQSAYAYIKTPSRNGAHLRSVRYDGILEVTDPVSFQEALVRGIGPGKAFGFGLLSVAPVSGRA